MSTTVDARVALMSRLNTPPYDDAAGTYSTPLGEAAQLLDAYRAAVLREAADKLDESETLRDLTDDHMGDVNAAANELRRMADALEAQDG